MAEQVHVGGDGQGLDVHRDNQLALTSTLFVAGGELEVVARRVVPVQGLLDRLAGEVEADARPVDAGLAVGVVVDLEDDVGLGGNVDADAIGQAVGLAAGGPEAQFVGLEPGPGGAA